MKILFRSKNIFILIISFFFIVKAQASHVAGGEIYYSCTSSPGIWKITLVLYADCLGSSQICSGGCGSPCNRTVSISGADSSCAGVSYGSVSMTLVNLRDAYQNSLCASAKSICDNMSCAAAGPFTPGIERYQFEGNVNLGPGSGIPASCCNIRIAFSECCRSTSINTGPVNNNLYFEAIINRCLSLSPCNSSPQLESAPKLFTCAGQPVVYSMGAFDPDHDSLTYELASVMVGQDTGFAYISPYSYLSPLPNNPTTGFQLDPYNGDLTYIPFNGTGGNFLGVVAVKIKQWKIVNGVYKLIGTTVRDWQSWIFFWPPDNPPYLSTSPSIANQPKTAWYVVPGQTLCFDVIAKDTDFKYPSLSDTTYLSWNNTWLAYMGAIFQPKYNPALRKTSGPREDIYQFCWTPDSTMVSSLPYYFTVNGKDNRCPLAGEFSRALSVTVLDPRTPLNAFILKAPNTNCYGWTLNYASSTTMSIISNEWRVSNTKGVFNNSNYSLSYSQRYDNIYFADTGKYVVKLILNSGQPNQAIFYDTIVHLIKGPAISLFVPDTTVCKNTLLKFKTQAVFGTKPYTYVWKNPAGDSLSFSDTCVIKPTAANANYFVTITDATGCSTFDFFNIKTNPLPALTRPQPVKICRNSALISLDTFSNDQPGGTGVWSYPPSPQALITGSVVQVKTDSLKNLPLVNQSTGADNWIKYTYTAPLTLGGCTNYDSANISVYATPVISFPKGITLCKKDSVYDLSILSATPAGGIWYGASVFQQASKYYFATALANDYPATNIIYYSYNHNYSDGMNCLSVDSNSMNVINIQKPVISGPNSVYATARYTYSVANHAGNNYAWNIYNGIIDSGFGSSIVRLAFVSPGYAKVVVKEINTQYGCGSDSAEKYITVTLNQSISTVSSFKNLNIYPNPANTELNIELGDVSEETTIELIDVLGKTLIRKSIHAKHNLNEKLDVSELARGVYFISLKVGEQKTQAKVLLK